MAVKELLDDEVDTSIIYVSIKEMADRLDLTVPAIRHRIKTGKMDALRYHTRLFILPDEAAKQENLKKCGLM